MIRKKEEIEANNFRIKTRTILTATEAHKLKSAKANTSKNNNNNKDYFIKSAKEMLKNRCTSTEAIFEKISFTSVEILFNTFSIFGCLFFVEF